MCLWCMYFFFSGTYRQMSCLFFLIYFVTTWLLPPSPSLSYVFMRPFQCCCVCTVLCAYGISRLPSSFRSFVPLYSTLCLFSCILTPTLLELFPFRAVPCFDLFHASTPFKAFVLHVINIAGFSLLSSHCMHLGPYPSFFSHETWQN